MAYKVKGKPWEYNGAINVEDCKTTLDCMNKAGLNFEVGKTELFAKIPINPLDMDDTLDKLNHNKKIDTDSHIFGKNLYASCPNSYCTYRKDFDIPLGFVKSKYTIVQNSEAFKFFDDAIGDNKAIWQTAGFFGNGERIFVSAKLPNNILVKGDPVENYLLFVNSHDGSGGVKILFTPIRVICQNTLAAALKCRDNYISFRHTQSVHDNINQAYKVLGIAKNMIDETNQFYNMLADIQLTDEDVMEFICKSNLNENEVNNLLSTGHTFKQLVYRDGLAYQDSKISTKKLNVISNTYDYYHSGIGQKEIVGTAWGAYNAITGYYSNVDNAEGIKRMDSIMFGDKSRKIKEPLEYEFA